jgi:hypothetical protein
MINLFKKNPILFSIAGLILLALFLTVLKVIFAAIAFLFPVIIVLFVAVVGILLYIKFK